MLGSFWTPLPVQGEVVILIGDQARSTCQYSRGTGVLRPKMLTETSSSPFSGLISSTVPFWRMVTTPLDALRDRARAIVDAAGRGTVVDLDALPGAGSLPGVTVPSAGVMLDGDHLAALRASRPSILARVRDQRTHLDLRGVDPRDDDLLVQALRTLP